MAVQPLSSANDRWFGRPLPCQLSNHTRAHRTAISLWQLSHAGLLSHAVLAQVSLCYPPLYGRLLTRYSPVRHCSVPEGTSPFDLNVLCTPPAFILSQDQTLWWIVSQPDLPTRTETLITQSDRFAQLLLRASLNSKEFSESLYIVVVQFSMSAPPAPWGDSLTILSHPFPFVNPFFIFFSVIFRGFGNFTAWFRILPIRGRSATHNYAIYRKWFYKDGLCCVSLISSRDIDVI